MGMRKDSGRRIFVTELYLDIETAPPSGEALAELKKSLFFKYPETNSPKSIPVHRGLKDPEKIATYEREVKARAESEWRDHNRSQLAKRAEALAATVLDGSVGQIVSIAWSIGDEPAVRPAPRDPGPFRGRQVPPHFLSH